MFASELEQTLNAQNFNRSMEMIEVLCIQSLF